MFATIEGTSTVLAETELGVAYSLLPADFEGKVCVVLTGRSSRSLVLPTVADGENAAKFAVGPLGGYSQARVYPAYEQDAITHECWTYWAFEE